ncbi:MAG: hypothetical protein R2826_01730 [Thermoleophilia bacterium]
MIVAWDQAFNAKWTRKGETKPATYDVHVEFEGPARPFMTDAGPIIAAIGELEGKDLKEAAGRSSLESVVLHIKGLVEPRLEPQDKLRRVSVVENGAFRVEV